MMMSEMMKSMSGNAGMNDSNNMSSMLPLMMMGGNGFTDMFDGMFDFDFSDDEIEDSDTDKEE